jgi:hypothetical protein
MFGNAKLRGISLGVFMTRLYLVKRLGSFAKQHEQKAEWCKRDGLKYGFWLDKARLIREAIRQLNETKI